MNMNEELVGASLQIGTKAAEAGFHAAEKTVETIAKLLQALSAAASRRAEEKRSVNSTDLTDLKPGETKITELQANAKKNGDTISSSENGFTKEDKKLIEKKAKEMGIPIAFTGKENKDNIYANVRTSDLPIFQRICTDVMKDKIASKPQELSNFKVKEWEMPFITNELNKHDLSAQFGKTKDGEHLCLFEKSDEKAILIARGEFVRTCNEINKEVSFDRDENGYFTIKDIRSGREVSFDNVPSREEMSETLQSEFGYEKNKADIACAKFGEENLEAPEKQRFFSDDPQNAFSKVDTNITLEGENVLVKDYTCWRLTPREDQVPKLVYSDNDGNFAVLNPEKMTKKEMSDVIERSLNIKDKATIEALTDKAEKVTDYYSKQNDENYSLNYSFSKSDFNMSDPAVADNMLRKDENGNTFTKELPVSSINNQIERNSIKEFTVTSDVTTVETDQNDQHYTSHDTQTLYLSFSDKKNAVKELTDLYKKQGIPDHISKQMAKDVINKAESQSAEKVLNIEEIKAETITISYAGKAVELSVTDREKAIEKISSSFGVSDEAAEKVLDKAIEKAKEAESATHQEKNEAEKSLDKSEKNDEAENKSENNSDTEKSYKNEPENKNGHELHKSDNDNSALKSGTSDMKAEAPKPEVGRRKR